MPAFPSINGQIKTPLRFYNDERLMSMNTAACANAEGCDFHLWVPVDRLLPFQVWRPTSGSPVTSWGIYDQIGTMVVDLTGDIGLLEVVPMSNLEYIIYSGGVLSMVIPAGLYHCRIVSDGITYYSDLFRRMCSGLGTTNLAVNGDFSDGLNGWTVGGEMIHAIERETTPGPPSTVCDLANTGKVIINMGDNLMYTCNGTEWEGATPADGQSFYLASDGTWYVYTAGSFLGDASPPPLTVALNELCWDGPEIATVSLPLPVGPLHIVITFGIAQGGLMTVTGPGISEAFPGGYGAEYDVNAQAGDVLMFTPSTEWEGCLYSVRIYAYSDELNCHPKLEWTNCGNVGNTYYEDGFTNILYLPKNALLSMPQPITVIEGEEDSLKNFTEKLRRNEVTYRIDIGMVPWFLLDAIAQIPLHDTVRLTLPNAAGPEVIIQCRVESERDEVGEECLAFVALTFKVDEAAVVSACCTTFDPPCIAACVEVFGYIDDPSPVAGNAYLHPTTRRYSIYSDDPPAFGVAQDCPTGLVSVGLVEEEPPPEPCVPTLTMVAAGDAPAFVAIDVAVGKAFVTNAESDNITVIDSDTDAVIATIWSSLNANPNPWGALVDPSSGLLYVANINSDTVSVIDTTTHAILFEINVSDRPFTFALNSVTGMLYVLTESTTPLGAVVEVIDTSTHTVVATVTVAPVSGFVHGSGLVVNEALNKVYMAGREGTDVHVIDGTTNTVVATIPVTATSIRNKQMALHIGLNKIYVLTKDDNVLTVIDCATDTIATTLPYAFNIDQVAVNQNNDEVYVRLPNSADIIDANTDTVVGSISGVGAGSVAWIAVDHANDILYFYDDGSNNTVKTYDANTHALRDEFSFAGTYAANMAVDPVRRKIYASVIGSDTVAVCQECFEKVPPPPAGPCDGVSLKFTSNLEDVLLGNSRSTTGYITVANASGQVTLGTGAPGSFITGAMPNVPGVVVNPFCLWSSDAEGAPSGNLTYLSIVGQGLFSASDQDTDASLLLVKNLDDNDLDATSVDHVLNNMNAALASGLVSLWGGFNASPTAASDDNVALLLANDWTVNTQ